MKEENHLHKTGFKMKNYVVVFVDVSSSYFGMDFMCLVNSTRR